MQTPDHIEHAAKAMDPDAFADRKPQRPVAELQWAVRRKVATDHAEALDAAGLLASSKHDAAVAALVLRDFGPDVQQELACDPEEECAEGSCDNCDLLFAVQSSALERADRIEREGGAK